MGRPPSKTSLHGAQTRKQLALASMRELDLAKRRGEVLDADAVASEWAGILRTVRAAMLAVPSRVRAALPHLTASDVGVIDAELRAALTALGTDDA